MSLEINELENEENKDGQEKKESVVKLTPEMEAAVKQMAKEMVEQQLASAGASKASDSKMETLISTLTQSILDNKKDDVFDDTSFNSRKNIDKEDILESPVIFYCPKSGHAIGGDRKNGRQVPPPLGIVNFKYMHTIKKQTGKDIHIQHWCKYECWSKSELEFLKGHSTFGSMFYEKANPLVQTEDTRMMVTLMRKMSSLKDTESFRVLAMMKEQGLEIGTDDVDEQRFMLAQHLAKKELNMIDNEYKTMANETMKAQALLKASNVKS